MAYDPFAVVAGDDTMPDWVKIPAKDHQGHSINYRVHVDTRIGARLSAIVQEKLVPEWSTAADVLRTGLAMALEWYAENTGDFETRNALDVAAVTARLEYRQARTSATKALIEGLREGLREASADGDEEARDEMLMEAMMLRAGLGTFWLGKLDEVLAPYEQWIERAAG